MATQAHEAIPNVLVVEDEFIVALDLSETVRELGYRVTGPYANTDHALIAINDDLPDFAILDVSTGDGEIFPLADVLTEAGVPIIFHSGRMTPQEMQSRYPDAQACSKPCPPDQLIAMMNTAIEAAQ